MDERSLSQYVRRIIIYRQPINSLRYRRLISESQSNTWSWQETELQLRTAELIEDNAQQALSLLVQYAQSSRMSAYPVTIILLT